MLVYNARIHKKQSKIFQKPCSLQANKTLIKSEQTLFTANGVIMQLCHLKPGLRLEIRRLLETEDEKNHEPKWLVSQLLDCLTDDFFLIAAPIDAFHIVEWPLGSKLELTFVQPQQGLWKFTAEICDCGKMEHIVFYKIKTVHGLERQQRRSHYRLDCMLDIEWQIARHEHLMRSLAVNISGGGISFICENLLPQKTKLNIRVNLENREIQAIGEVLYCEKKPGREIQYCVAVKFTKISSADQEAIIK